MWTVVMWKNIPNDQQIANTWVTICQLAIYPSITNEWHQLQKYPFIVSESRINKRATTAAEG